MKIDELKKFLASRRLVTKEEAAKGQMEQAIWLWFHEGCDSIVSEPSAVHTLAVAAQGVLAAICRDRNIELSPVAKLMASEKYKASRNPQSFFKHGHYGKRDEKKSHVPNFPSFTEMILADDVGSYNRVFGLSTPLLDIFLFRYSLTYPQTKISLKTLEIKLVERGLDIASLARLGRKRFYDVVLPFLVEFTASARAAHSANPPRSA